MKKIFTLFLLLFTFLNNETEAQNWQMVISNSDSYLRAKYSEINMISFDSVKTINGDTIYFPYKYKRENIEITNQCLDSNGSFLSRNKIIVHPNGNTLVFNGSDDSILIKPQANLADKWIAYSLPAMQRLEAVVTKLETDTVLGVADIVKTIKFRVIDDVGQTVTNPFNALELKISKNNGLVSTPDFYYINHRNPKSYYVKDTFRLIGKSNPNRGVVNLTYRDIYNYNVGDEFHIARDSVYYNYIFDSIDDYRPDIVKGDGYEKATITYVLKKQISANNDTLEYTMGNCSRIIRYKKQKLDTIYTQEYTNEKIVFSKLDEKVFSKRLFEPIKLKNGRDSGYFTLVTEKYNYKYKDIGVITKSFERPGYGFYQNCYHQLMIDYAYFGDYYIDGCGGGYFSCCLFGPNVDSRDIVYFKKGNKTWGKPFARNCADLESNVKEVKFNDIKVNIFPNPVTSTSQINVSGFGDNGCELRIVNVLGAVERVYKVNNNNNNFVFGKENLKSGIYFYIVSSPNGKVGSGKIVIM